MFLAVTGMLMAMSYTEEQRRKIANVVHGQRLSRGLDKEPASRAAGVNSITWKRVEDGLGVRDASLSKILGSLGLGSVEDVLAIGIGTPPEYPAHSKLPRLPRDAPNAPVYSEIDMALGINPGAPDAVMPLSNTERAVLSRIRNKVFEIGSEDAGLTDEEARILTRFIEDGELRTLHARIDWLPRAEQLEVSTLVNDLQLRLEYRWVADGYSNESPQLPDYAQPNPLPREGRFPDPQDFPIQVPVFTTKEQANDVSGDQTAQSDASTEAETEEVSAVVGDGPKLPPFAAGSKWPRKDSGVDGGEEGEQTHQL